MNDYLKIMSNSKGLDQLVDKYKIRTFLVKDESRLVQEAEYRGWEIIYSEPAVIVLFEE